jgi:hypothetical protein
MTYKCSEVRAKLPDREKHYMDSEIREIAARLDEEKALEK